jgi:hypothetical protein
MADKWYNSKIAEGVGIAAIVTSLAFGAATFMRGCSDSLGPSPSASQIEMERVKRGYEIQEADLNGNGIPEKFYSIDGKVALVELDGKPVSELYKK